MFELSYIEIFVLVTIAISFGLVLKGSVDKRSNVFKNLVIWFVLIFIGSTYLIDLFYKKELNEEKVKLLALLDVTPIDDSLFLNYQLRLEKISNLRNDNDKLYEILKNVKGKEAVLGSQDVIESNIVNKINNNNSEIKIIEQYNDIMDNSLKSEWKGNTSSGNTSNFLFQCPKDFESEMLDLKLLFQDQDFISKIGFMYLTFSEVINENEHLLLFEQLYRPKEGVNAFAVRNYFKSEEKVEMQIGYILKTEIEKEYPRFEKVTCRNF